MLIRAYFVERVKSAVKEGSNNRPWAVLSSSVNRRTRGKDEKFQRERERRTDILKGEIESDKHEDISTDRSTF